MPSTLVKVASIGGTLSAVGCGIGLYWKFKGPVTYDEPQLISALFEKKRIKLLVSASDSNNDPKWKKAWGKLKKDFARKNPGSPWNIAENIWIGLQGSEGAPIQFREACDRFQKEKIKSEGDPIYIVASTYCIE